jgi:hypothetical protein
MTPFQHCLALWSRCLGQRPDTGRSPPRRFALRVLFRVAVALLFAIPVLLVLVTVFAFEARRGASLSRESGASCSLERGAAVGASLRLSEALTQVSR